MSANALPVSADEYLRFLPEIILSIAGTLLLCDAWFDTLTSRSGTEFAWAAVEALVAELPLATFCFWIAFDAEAVAVARRFVGVSGSTGRREATG